MIVIKGLFDGEQTTIIATGLGDLGWQLDSMGLDTSEEDERFVVSFILMLNSEKRKENYESRGVGN